MSIPVLTRRSAARGLVLGVVAAVVGFAVARRSSAAGPRPAGAAANGYGAAMTTGTGGSGGGSRLAGLDQVPTGGGVVLADVKVVLTRPSADDVQGFSATCTHQGCTVSDVSGGQIHCPCHGSAFDAATGAVVHGPATRPLPRVPVVVRDQSVFSA